MDQFQNRSKIRIKVVLDRLFGKVSLSLSPKLSSRDAINLVLTKPNPFLSKGFDTKFS